MSATSSSTSSFSMNSALMRPLSSCCFLLRLLVGHQVELPAGELGGEAHVLAAAADRMREVFLVDHDVHRVLLLVDDDRAHFGRRQRVDHELRRVGRPQHDVDALAGELVGHRLHARAAHADAGADRVDARVVGLAPRSWRAMPGSRAAALISSRPSSISGTSSSNSFMMNSRRDARQDQLRAARLRGRSS